MGIEPTFPDRKSGVLPLDHGSRTNKVTRVGVEPTPSQSKCEILTIRPSSYMLTSQTDLQN